WRGGASSAFQENAFAGSSPRNRKLVNWWSEPSCRSGNGSCGGAEGVGGWLGEGKTVGEPGFHDSRPRTHIRFAFSIRRSLPLLGLWPRKEACKILNFLRWLAGNGF